jgi:hypothetical protein
MSPNPLGVTNLAQMEIISRFKNEPHPFPHNFNEKKFADTIFPALKALNSRLYGNAYERLHVVLMASKSY